MRYMVSDSVRDTQKKYGHLSQNGILSQPEYTYSVTQSINEAMFCKGLDFALAIVQWCSKLKLNNCRYIVRNAIYF